MARLKNIDLINECDAYPYADAVPQQCEDIQKSVYTLMWEDVEGAIPVGYVPPRVLEALVDAPANIRGELRVDRDKRTIFAFQKPTEQDRSELIAELAGYWRSTKAFRILEGWRDELWPVYGRKGELLYNIERSATGLFGVMRYGVHMTAYVRSECHYGMKIWVPRRSATKSTFPGMLDNTVAGGLMTGEDPFECMIREADEEASLPGEIMREQAKAVGGVTYIYVTEERAGEAGFVYPECQWIYDIELPDNLIPNPKDGEVAEFNLCTVEEVQRQLAQGLFKPNCALVLLDFFIRHGILTPDNEPDYNEIKRRIHRILPFPGPHNEDPFLGAFRVQT